MKTTSSDALLLVLVMGAVILFCRALPFLLFSKSKNESESAGDEGSHKKIKKEMAFLSFVEKTVPPVAMTVLAFNSIAVPVRENLQNGITVVIASIVTALFYLLRRNPLIGILSGTAAYILLERFIVW